MTNLKYLCFWITSTTRKKSPEAPLMYCFWCLSFCAGRRLSSHNSTEAFGSHCTIDGMLWLTYEITYCVFFAVDHVLVYFVTIGTTGAIFSLQFTKNRLAAELRPDPLGELERSPIPLSRKTGGLLLREGEGREGKEMGEERTGVREGKGREGREGRRKEGGRRERKRGRGGTTAPLTQIPGSAPDSRVSFRTTSSDLAKYSMTRSIVRPLCDSWVSKVLTITSLQRLFLSISHKNYR